MDGHLKIKEKNERSKSIIWRFVIYALLDSGFLQRTWLLIYADDGGVLQPTYQIIKAFVHLFFNRNQKRHNEEILFTQGYPDNLVVLISEKFHVTVSELMQRALIIITRQSKMPSPPTGWREKPLARHWALILRSPCGSIQC